MLKALTSRITLMALLTAVFFFALMPLASAEAATFSGMSPADGGTITWGINPEIRVNVIDTVNLDKDSLTATVNGKSEPNSFTFKEIGYFENEDYQEGWVVTGYDYTQGTISIKPAMLADGPAAVAVSIKNIDGTAFTKTWTFNVSQRPSLSDFKPAYPAVVGSSTTISAKVTDNGVISQVKMTVNGAVVPAVFDAAAGRVSYTPPTLTSGTNYNVGLTVTDSFGLTASVSWSFYSEFYQDSQVSSLACRDCHSGASAPIHPMNNCALCHSGGPISGHGTSDCESCHGGHGYNLLDNYNCTVCHQSTYPNIPAPHPVENTAAHNTATNMGECQKCHQSSLTTEHLQRTDDDGAALNCLTCHKSTTASVQLAVSAEQTQCEACHGQADHEALHDNSVLDSKCTTCHINNLSREHLSNPKTQTRILDCATCHKNPDVYITAAINAGNQNCAACHSEGHNMILADKVPSDIPLYAAFQWSLPNKASLSSGEPWMPAEYNAGGKSIYSNRRKDVTGDQVWTFYRNELNANGWTVVSGTPAAGTDNYRVKFTKATRQVDLFFFGGAVPGTGQPESGGYRIQILYK